MPVPSTHRTSGNGDGLSEQELARYSAQLAVPAVGREGQLKLKRARVLVVGAGGLGSAAAFYLAAAGVGRLGLVDHDQVEWSNLQRQILYATGDVGRKKVEAAAERILALNPSVEVNPICAALTRENAAELVRRYDIVVDATDHFASRYLINDACVFLGKPMVHGAVYHFEGQATVFPAQGRPCYRCLYPAPPQSGATTGGAVLGAVAGLIGVIQATETIKLILGAGSSLAGRLLLYDGLAMRFSQLIISRDPGCISCGDR